MKVMEVPMAMRVTKKTKGHEGDGVPDLEKHPKYKTDGKKRKD